MEFEPFDIGRFLVAPGRRFRCLLIKAKLMPGVLEKLASIASEHNITVPYISYSMPREYGEVTKAIVFIDVTEATAPVEELLEQARKLKFVEEIKDARPEIEDFPLDSFSFPLMIGEGRAIILRWDGIKGIINGLRKRLGSAAEAIQYFIGLEAGLEFGKNHKKLGEALGIKKVSDIFSKISAPLFMPIGFGVMEVSEISDSPPHALLRVYRCFECECAEEKTDKHYSHLVRGMIAGVFTQLFGIEMESKEVKCIAMGAPYCEFEVYPRK